MKSSEWSIEVIKFLILFDCLTSPLPPFLVRCLVRTTRNSFLVVKVAYRHWHISQAEMHLYKIQMHKNIWKFLIFSNLQVGNDKIFQDCFKPVFVLVQILAVVSVCVCTCMLGYQHCLSPKLPCTVKEALITRLFSFNCWNNSIYSLKDSVAFIRLWLCWFHAFVAVLELVVPTKGKRKHWHGIGGTVWWS